jgi:argininosuccinate synthase
MNASELKGQTIAFAASGGLDSCTVAKWLTERGVTVACFTADLAQPDEESIDDIRTRMLACGAVDCVALPLRDAIAEAGVQLIQSQGRYEGDYWNTTGIGRHVIVQGMVAAMKQRGIGILSHGATGRGNDQVRFQLCTNMLAPTFKIYAPWRDREFLACFQGREQMIAFCETRGLPIKATRKKPYSTDANLLGLTHEAGELESLATAPAFISPGMGVHAKDAPAAGETVAIRFERGRPVALNGRPVTAFEAIDQTNKLAGKHGVGIASHLVENRFVGIKSRGVYEAPGMETLGTAYAYLLQLILDRRARKLFAELSRTHAEQIYQGYGFDLATTMVRQALAPITERATGSIKLHLCRGQAAFAGASDVPHSLYSEANASMEAIGEFDHADSEGFLSVLQVSARAAAVAGQTKGF